MALWPHVCQSWQVNEHVWERSPPPDNSSIRYDNIVPQIVCSMDRQTLLRERNWQVSRNGLNLKKKKAKKEMG